jgi:hypothetical protein
LQINEYRTDAEIKASSTQIKTDQGGQYPLQIHNSLVAQIKTDQGGQYPLQINEYRTDAEIKEDRKVLDYESKSALISISAFMSATSSGVLRILFRKSSIILI